MQHVKFASVALLAFMAAAPVIVGCDKTKEEHQTEVKKPDGSTETDKSKTTVSPSGAEKTTTEHETSKPAP